MLQRRSKLIAVYLWVMLILATPSLAATKMPEFILPDATNGQKIERIFVSWLAHCILSQQERRAARARARLWRHAIPIDFTKSVMTSIMS